VLSRRHSGGMRVGDGRIQQVAPGVRWLDVLNISVSAGWFHYLTVIVWVRLTIELPATPSGSSASPLTG
jgi:hypothetical protein